MRYIEPEPTNQAASAEEERLRKENEDLKRQLHALQVPGHGSSHSGLPPKLWRPSAITIWSIVLGMVVLTVVAFFAGYIPLRTRNALIVSEAHDQEVALPRVQVIAVGRSAHDSALELPGNIQAITEAPILARADGYILRRMVDIGDRVRAGQPVAEIEAPEMDDQIRQSKASLQQAQGALQQALANYQQGKSDTEMARITADRWKTLVARGVVSRQDNDQYQAQYQSRASSLQSLEQAIAAQKGNVAAAEANVARLERMKSYLLVKAPFDGAITLRNVDVGALVTAGNTLLFRIAQTANLRTYVNVPQTHANSVRPGQTAVLTVSNLPGRRFPGKVARTATALDPTSRTLLIEIQVPNPEGVLFPGMYAQVDLGSARANPPLLVPSDALVVGSNGATVAVVRQDHTVHLQKIKVGRDYGDRMEVVSGLQEGDAIIPNPGDVAREGLRVDPAPVR
ncbi:MAG: efflux transporter, family, subunit [Bryobacterales bacterium]|nr:efflux transporter, family, subunit [Bryobacterales bacterium]